MSGESIFNDVDSIYINNKEVQSIKRVDDEAIIYEKNTALIPSIVLTVTGSSFSTFMYANPEFRYTGEVFVDWGDNTELEEYTGGQLSHSFSDGLNSHTISVYGNISSIGKHCFESCEGLTSVTLLDNVTTIEEYSFASCKSLTSVESNSVTTLKDYCFNGCSGLTSFNIPSSVTYIGNVCFGYCTGLNLINIPSSVTYMGDKVFYYCSNLKLIKLNWTGDDIIPYNSNWLDYAYSLSRFSVPKNTRDLYIAKGYSSVGIRYEFDGIELAVDKDILSYNNGDNPDVTTFVVQLTLDEEPSPVSRESVTFEVRKKSDDSLVETSSELTNVNGVASVSYTSKGIGDIYVKASCGSSVSKTFAIDDCSDYQPLTSNAHQSRWTIPSGMSVSYDANGMYCSASSFKDAYCNTEMTSPCSMEFTLVDYTPRTNVPTPLLYIWNSNNTRTVAMTQQNGVITYGIYGEASRTLTHSFVKGAVYRFELLTNKVKFYENDVLLFDLEYTTSLPLKFGLAVAQNRPLKIKDLKLKPL